MRIGIDGSLLYGQYSGVEYAIHHLLRELAVVDRQNEYVIYVDADFVAETNSPPNFRWQHTHFHGRQRFMRILWQQRQLRRQILADQLDVFHGPGYVIPLNCPVPSVVTVYDIIALTHPRLCRVSNRLHYGWILPRTLDRATCIVVPSESVKHEILERHPAAESRIRVVPLGINPSFFDPPSQEDLCRLKSKYQLPDRFLLFVGNLEAKKNLPRLMNVFHSLKIGHHLPHHLVLAGSTQHTTPAVTALIENAHLKPFVHALGYVPEADLPSLYCLAEVFVFPSLVEGFGLPVLEAMALGTAVVASDRGALPEVVGDAGILCAPEDSQSVASALHRIISDSELRADLVARGKLRAQQYSWQNTAMQMLELYREVERAL